jgi:hypothetical protein
MSQVVSSLARKAVAVTADVYRRNSPIVLRGTRLTITAPTSQNIVNATTYGTCWLRGSSF